MAPGWIVEPQVATLGVAPNHIAKHGGFLWIVESGSNTISRYDLDTGRLDSGFVDVGNNRNPYDVAFGDDAHVYVSNYLTNTISVADQKSGDIIKEISHESLYRPSGITATRDHIYVTNASFDGQEYLDGGVTVISRETFEVVAVHALTSKNPQFASTVSFGGEEHVVIVSTGGLGVADGRYVPTSDGVIEVLTSSLDVTSPERRSFMLPRSTTHPGRGAPGRALPSADGRFLYFASATAPVLFKLDLKEERWVRGVDDPIVLYETEKDALHHGFLDEQEGVLYVTSFNSDQMYLLDTSCDEVLSAPFALGVADDLLEGPHGVVLHAGAQGPEAFFITSLSGVLGRVRLNYRDAR